MTPGPLGVVVEVKCETLELTRGVWCGRCLLPSATTGVFAASLAGRLFSVLTVTSCGDCGDVKRGGAA